MNQASHYIDLLNWLVGPVETISASISTRSRNIEAEDTAAIQLKWRNGALGTMAVTMLTYPENIEGSITILGDKGTVKVGGKAVNNIDIWRFEHIKEIDKQVREKSYEIKNIYGSGHIPYYKNMLDVMQGESRNICRGSDGLKSLELLIAAYRSARDKKIIGLPLEL